MRKSYYKRWVEIDADYDFEELVEIAKKHMAVPYAGKPDICCWYGFYLYGAKEQLEELEREWTAKGLKVFNRKPRGAWNIPERKVPRPDAPPFRRK
jgi:hypothetical protein